MIIQQHKKKIIVGAVGLLLSSPFLLHYTGGNEGLKFKPYRDSGGVLTVCNGITGEGVIAGKTYNQSECDGLLAKRLEVAGRGVLSCVHVPLNQNQYNAYTDLAFNIGVGAFCRSGSATALNQRNYSLGCDRMLAWDGYNSIERINGKDVRVHHKLKGLVTRRQSNRKLCLTPVQTVVKK